MEGSEFVMSEPVVVVVMGVGVGCQCGRRINAGVCGRYLENGYRVGEGRMFKHLLL